MTRGIHWFRNDLRLHDNVGLTTLAESVEAWAAIFVVDPAFIGRSGSDAPRVRFLFECLERLEQDLLSRGVTFEILEGRPERLIPDMMKRAGAEVVTWNSAPTPMGRRRDQRVADAVHRAGGSPVEVLDHTVFGPDEIRTKAGGSYSVYTPYRNEWWRQWERQPRFASRRSRLPRSPIGDVVPSDRRSKTFDQRVEGSSGPLRGGEQAAIRRLRSFLSGPARRYHLDRDRPDLDGTSRLSSYLRFGAVSIRRCFSEGLRMIESEPGSREGVRKWLDELIWREFYHAVLFHSPHVLSGSFRPEYDRIEWQGSDAQFDAWCEGRTGYPFIDAGMRQLRETGWMHNRVRMVVASFLTKDLLIDWRRGERFFAESLVDWDPASNNGGWQWSASTGTDAQPYFRIFNPVAQGERWDPDGRYVRQWVPELRSVEKRWIHKPWEARGDAVSYPDPIVDHAVQRVRTLDEFKRVRAISA